MKKTLTIPLALLFVLTLFSCGSTQPTLDVSKLERSYPDLRGQVLNVYNWGEYISPDAEGNGLNVVAEFEKLTGAKVYYNTFDSNEDMYAKLAGGGANYDVIIPSDYMIERLIAENRLHKLDYDKLSNYHYIKSDYKNLFYDPENAYTVPYSIGMVGLIYNTKFVKTPPTSWSAMWDTQYEDNILQFNNPRDAFGLAQFLLGQNVNTEDAADWQAATDKLLEQKPLLQRYVMDEIYNLMENDEAALAPYYVGDFVLMRESNENLEFVYPEEGTNFFYDCMCIPNTAQNPEAAHVFIDFMLEPEIALSNAEAVMYAVPHTGVLENDAYSLKNNPYIYPATLPKTQEFHNLSPESIKLMNDLWVKIKQS
jgi:spermidine/putrescine transport system substrate-binding protein